MGTAEQMQVGCIRLNTLSVRSLESLLRSLGSGVGLQRALEGSTLLSFVRARVSSHSFHCCTCCPSAQP